MVSIIIPVYQVAPYIGDCLLSVMSQTFTGAMECLLVDDCGTDESMAIAERLIREYNDNLNLAGKGERIRFRILHHKQNRGLSAARNTGMAHASGEYIYFLDSDDEITADCIEILMSKADEYPQAELIQGNYHSLSATSKPTARKKEKTASVIATNKEVRKCFYQSATITVTAWNKLFRRSFLEKHQLKFMEGVVIEDTPWMFQMLKHLTYICLVSQITYYYKIRLDSIVTGANYKAMADCLRTIYRHIVTNLTPEYEREEFDFYARKFCFFYARFLNIAPVFKYDLQLWQETSKVYGSKSTRLRLKASRCLAKFKYGWVIFSLLKLMDEPSETKVEILRMCSKLSKKDKR